MSSDNSEELVNIEPTPEITRPAAPSPTATSREVFEFLTKFFQALDFERTVEQAQEIAKKGKMDGISLYEQTEQEFVDIFGREGRMVYKALQRSKWGYYGNLWPKIQVVQGTLVFTGSFECLLEFWWRKDVRTFIFPIVCTLITVSLAILKISCKSQFVLDSKRIPEAFKIRHAQ